MKQCLICNSEAKVEEQNNFCNLEYECEKGHQYLVDYGFISRLSYIKSIVDEIEFSKLLDYMNHLVKSNKVFFVAYDDETESNIINDYIIIDIFDLINAIGLNVHNINNIDSNYGD